MCSFIISRFPPDCASAYTYDDAWQDTSLNQFNINKTPAEVFTILNDIKGINPYLRVHLLPWSPVRTEAISV